MDIRKLAQDGFLNIQTLIYTFGDDGIPIALDLAESLNILPKPGDKIGEGLLKDRLKELVAKHPLLRGAFYKYIAG